VLPSDEENDNDGGGGGGRTNLVTSRQRSSDEVNCRVDDRNCPRKMWVVAVGDGDGGGHAWVPLDRYVEGQLGLEYQLTVIVVSLSAYYQVAQQF